MVREIKTERCKVDSRLSEICRWVCAAADKNFEKVLSENSLEAYSLKKMLYEYEKKCPEKYKRIIKYPYEDIITDHPFKIMRNHLLNMEDGIQTDYLIARGEIDWNGGFEKAGFYDSLEKSLLVLHAFDDYWSTKGKEVRLSMNQVRDIANGKIKEIETHFYIYPENKKGDFAEEEKYLEEQRRYLEVTNELMKAFPNGYVAEEEEFKKFEEEWKRKRGVSIDEFLHPKD